MSFEGREVAKPEARENEWDVDSVHTDCAGSSFWRWVDMYDLLFQLEEEVSHVESQSNPLGPKPSFCSIMVKG